MNTSTIMNLIREDATIPNDVPGFIARMNDKNIKQVVSVKTVVEDQVNFISIADQNGGDCTQRNVDDALALMAQEPLLQNAKDIYDDVLSKISTGEVTDVDQVAAEFSASSLAVASAVNAVASSGVASSGIEATSGVVQ